jgi:hypothetical protein
MLRVPAGFQQILRGFHGKPDLGQLLILGMLFTEVSAKSALPLMNTKHRWFTASSRNETAKARKSVSPKAVCCGG